MILAVDMDSVGQTVLFIDHRNFLQVTLNSPNKNAGNAAEKAIGCADIPM